LGPLGALVTLPGPQVAAYSGDVRKALQMCVKAIDVCRARHIALGELDAESMVVSASDVNAAHKLIGESAFHAAVVTHSRRVPPPAHRARAPRRRARGGSLGG
jgi:hypothetical protein